MKQVDIPGTAPAPTLGKDAEVRVKKLALVERVAVLEALLEGLVKELRGASKA